MVGLEIGRDGVRCGRDWDCRIGDRAREGLIKEGIDKNKRGKACV